MKDNSKHLQDYNFITKYSHKRNDGSKESWNEAVHRIWDMHREKYKDIDSKQLTEMMNSAEEAEKRKEFLSAQRLRQFASLKPNTGIFKHNFKAYNCSATYADRPEIFNELMYVLLTGSGAGVSIQHTHIDKLPVVKQRIGHLHTWKVEDSIEGWADAVHALIDSYFIGDKLVQFDYSEIRQKGTLIAGQFLAPGPEGLKTTLMKLDNILYKAKDRNLRSIEVYDMIMWIADAVLSGGVRRSAILIQFDAFDEVMMNAKTGNWGEENPQRALSNNSAVLIRNKAHRGNFDRLISSTKEFGEPGFLFLEHPDVVLNPCAEISMIPRLEDGTSGWSVCNLTELNGVLATDIDKFKQAAIHAAVAGTLQAGYTSFPYLGKVTEEIIKRDALIGVSITGWMDNPTILFNEDNMRDVANIIKLTNRAVADILGINHAKRTTTTKPSGNASILLGTTSGIHGEHSRKYIRNVRSNKSEIGQYVYGQHNPFAISNDETKATDSIISFALKAKPGSILKSELLGVSQLEYVKKAQSVWVEEGTAIDETFGIKLRHNISNTIQVPDDKWDEVADFIWNNRNTFAGISLLSTRGDLDYANSPFQEVKSPIELANLYGSGAILASGLITEVPSSFKSLWDGCNAAKHGRNLKPKNSDDLITKINMNKQYDWVRRLKKFSKNFCDNDLDKAIYCVKDVSLLHKWNKLNHEAVNVDWSKVDFSADAFQAAANVEAACSGGACETL